MPPRTNIDRVASEKAVARRERGITKKSAMKAYGPMVFRSGFVEAR